MVNGSASIHIQPDDLAAYLAGGWTVAGLRYSEGGEAVDAYSHFLMTKGTASIWVLAASVSAYLADGYLLKDVHYGSTDIDLPPSALEIYLDTPNFLSAEIGTINDTTLAVTFSTEISSADYAAGVTILVDAEEQEISAAVRQADLKTVYYTIPAVVNDAEVSWAYDDATGEIASANDGSPLDDVSAETVTNNVAAVKPAFASGEIGTVDATTVAVTFSTNVIAASSDYLTGVTIRVNSIAASISSATRQSNHKIVYYVIPAVDGNDVVTFSYSAVTGKIKNEDDTDGIMDTLASGAITNHVALVPPTYASGEVGTVDASTVVITFSIAVSATDPTVGVTIKVNGDTKTAVTFNHSASDTYQFSIAPTAVVAGDVVTWAYVKASGNIVNAADGAQLNNVSAQTVTNNVAE